MIFNFNSAELEEFALLSEMFPDNFRELFVDTTVSVKVDIENKTLLFGVTVQYMADEIPQVKAKGLFYFMIKDESWAELIIDSNIHFKKEALRHLGNLSVDTLRGMLVMKLNSTFYKNIILPPIAINDLLSEDLSFDLNSEYD